MYIEYPQFSLVTIVLFEKKKKISQYVKTKLYHFKKFIKFKETSQDIY